MPATRTQADFSVIPSVDRVLSETGVRALFEQVDAPVITGLVRDCIDAFREAMGRGEAVGSDREAMVQQVVDNVRRRLDETLAPSLFRVVNATGIVLHTNLGRAPLPKAALEQISHTAGYYSSLEVDLESGQRGARIALVEEILCKLTGAEAACVVNNNAAAVLLVLNTLALGREAVVSRGQLIEIGGSFRMPDLMARSGAMMVEVGTTNRTHLRDFEAALSDRTGLMLAVHPSNYKVMGFTAEVALEELVALGRRHGVAVAHDLGGGVLVDLRDYGLPCEPLVSDSVATGADVVSFSGDKVLGGPQAGLLVGRREALDRIRRNPLMRALRCGKLTYAALEATLKLFLNRKALLRKHPTLRMLTEPAGSLRRRGVRLLRRLADLADRGVRLGLEPSVAQTGSGALPLEEIPSTALTLSWPGRSVGDLAARLRRHTPPVLGYVREDRLFLDLRTVRPDELAIVAEALRWSVEKTEAREK